MPCVILRHVVALAPGPRPSDKRIGLTGWAADQDRFVKVPTQPRDRAVCGSFGGFGAKLQAARLFGRQRPSLGIHRGPVRFGDQTGMKVDELPRQATMPCAMIPQERAKGQGPMGRCLLLDRKADLEGPMPVVDERGKSLAQPAWTGKKIDDAESGRQIRLLTNCIRRVYTKFMIERQEPCDGYRRPADPFPNDGRDQG